MRKTMHTLLSKMAMPNLKTTHTFPVIEDRRVYFVLQRLGRKKSKCWRFTKVRETEKYISADKVRSRATDAVQKYLEPLA